MTDELDGVTPVVESETELTQSVAVRIGRDRYRTDAMVRGHPLVVDEPLAVGGGDAGPTPFELICVALGSCITITLRMYADRKGWPLEEVTARVLHRKDPSTEGPEAMRDAFSVLLELRGRLDESQKARLLEIAERCPVTRALRGDPGIEVRSA